MDDRVLHVDFGALVVSEAWAPNLPVARERLEPLGVEVRAGRGELLVAADGEFDLVLNRHGAFTAAELWRVLAPGGFFLTQQPGSRNDQEFYSALDAGPPVDPESHTLDTVADALRTQGFVIDDAREELPAYRYHDIAAVIYQLRAVSWTIPDFDVERYDAQLRRLDAKIRAGPVDLGVCWMRGWHRSMSYEQTGQPWVLPSPNMPTLDTAYVYPGTCLFSGTNLSQGRGTTRPFQIVGAPFVDHRWAEALTAYRLPGVAFREAYFNPTFSTYQGKNCGGVDVLITDAAAVDAVRIGIALLVTLKRLYPNDFAWLNAGTATEPKWWIDNLTGSDRVRLAVDAGHDVDAIVDGWQAELAEFGRIRRRYLRY